MRLVNGFLCNKIVSFSKIVAAFGPSIIEWKSNLALFLLIISPDTRSRLAFDRKHQIKNLK